MIDAFQAASISKWLVSNFEREISKALGGELVFSNELRERLKYQLFNIFTSYFHTSVYNLNFEEPDFQHEEAQKLISEVSLGRIRIQIQFPKVGKGFSANYGILRENGPLRLVPLGEYSHTWELSKEIYENPI